MGFSAEFLITFGGILLLSLFTHALGKHTVLPRVTLLMIFGVLIGNSGLDIVPLSIQQHYQLIADMALLMVGFLLGGKLTFKTLKQSSTSMLWISICAAFATATLVAVCLFMVGVPLALAIILGCIAAATDATAIFDVVKESGRESRFNTILLSVVALDDVWALLLFGVGLAVVTTLNGLGALDTVLTIGWDIGGAIALGICLGLPAAFLTGRVKANQPIIAEALGLVFMCGGLAHWLDVSFLISAMIMGMTIANLARHHNYPFHAIEDVEWPVMVIFFVLAGASLNIELAAKLGVVGLVYLVTRGMGKIVGAWLGGTLSSSPQNINNWMGFALLPQAGVAIGLALMASKHFPAYQQMLLTIVISSTVVFEIIGPVFTRLAISKAGTDETD